MHEMGLAMRIVEIALAETEKAKASRLCEVEVEVGEVAGVLREALEFCLPAAAHGTLAEQAVFTIVAVPGQGHCQACQRQVAVSAFPAQCPECGGFGVTITAGTELRPRSINVE